MEILLLGLAIFAITIGDYCLIKRRDLYGKAGSDLIQALKPCGLMEGLCMPAILLSLSAVAAMMALFYKTELTNIVRHLALLGVLWPVAVTDYQEYRIPNKMMLLGIGCRAMLLIPELFILGASMKAVVVLELVAAAGSIVICLICMVLSRGSLGMGDLKLMVVMSLFLGVEGICYAMFFSLVISFVASVFLLLSKKKGRKDAIPFAPFILVGTLLSFILSGM